MIKNIYELNWEDHDWSYYQAKVYDKQHKIYELSRFSDTTEFKVLQDEIIKMPEAKLIAVRKITQENTGKKTKGVDGVLVLNSKKRNSLAKTLKINNKTSPIRRVFIPKPGKLEKRPLGIPTIRDKAKQELVKMALEPQWEGIFSNKDRNSFGFRPGRSANDARKTISRWIWTPKYIVDADIRKCFDQIDHEYLLAKIDTTEKIKLQISVWLKAGIMADGSDSIEINTTGTPQGGVISPLLANIALCGMEQSILDVTGTFKNMRNVGFVRYADDFLVITETHEKAEEAKNLIGKFIKTVGLEFSEEKTKIVKSTDGFDFLGFKFKTIKCSYHHATSPSLKQRRKSKKNSIKELPKGYTYKIIPSPNSISRHKYAIKEYLKKNSSGTPQGKIIEDLSRKINGWTRYFSVCNATRTFSILDKWLYNQLFSWSTRRCKGNRKLAFEKYYIPIQNRRWNFGYKKNNGQEIYLKRYDSTPIQISTQIKSQESPYNGNLLYWAERMSYDNKLSKWAGRLIRKQNGQCGFCNKIFHVWDQVEIHHKVNLAQGGKKIKNNIEIVHKVCHDRIHK